MTEKPTFQNVLKNIDKDLADFENIDTDYAQGVFENLILTQVLVTKLQANYAPPVVMTPALYEYFQEFKADGKQLSEILTFEDEEAFLHSGYFGDKFWSPLTENQVAQAWLHPETIINSETGKPFVEE